MLIDYGGICTSTITNGGIFSGFLGSLLVGDWDRLSSYSIILVVSRSVSRVRLSSPTPLPRLSNIIVKLIVWNSHDGLSHEKAQSKTHPSQSCPMFYDPEPTDGTILLSFLPSQSKQANAGGKKGWGERRGDYCTPPGYMILTRREKTPQ